MISTGMSLALRLDRPLAALDVESTGTDPRKDRIVELCVAVYRPDVPAPDVRTRRFNPCVPIPAEATAVHGITDDDVAGEPRFDQCAQSLLHLLDDCDLMGFNVRRFDLPMLIAEFERAGHRFDVDGRRIIDALAIYHLHHPRNLEAAVREYLGREHEGAHGAEADTLATAELLGAQVAAHGLPADLDGLSEVCDRMWPYETEVDRWFDRSVSDNPRQWLFKRGKHRGDELASQRSYLEWLGWKADDVHPDVVEIARNVVLGRYG